MTHRGVISCTVLDRLSGQCLLAALFVVLLVVHSLSPTASVAAKIDAVQSGTATIAVGNLSTTVTITSVDLTRSFLVFNYRFSDENPSNGQVAGQITNATTVTFQRNSTGPEVNIAWYVAEFTSGVTVQRGNAGAGGTTSVPITSVDLSKSFPIISFRTNGSVFSQDDYVQAQITTSTNLNLTMNASGAGSAVIEWQVVEFDDANVQTGDVSFGTSDGVLTASPASVDPAKSWLIYTYRSDSGTSANISQKLVRGLITDPTTLTFDRDLTGQQLDLTWYLVEFTDATTVQQGSAGFTSSATVRNVAISTVDVTQSLAASGYFMRGGKSPYAGGDNPGVAWVTTELTSDTLTITRNFTGSSVADIGYALVSFEAPNTGPPVVTSAIPDTTVDEDAPLDNYVDLNAVFTDPDEGGALIFSIESNSDPGLLTASIDADSALDLSLVLDQTGSGTIVVRATDSGALFVEDTFVVDVTPVNDAPRVVAAIPDTIAAKNTLPIVKYRDLNDVFDDPEDGNALGFVEKNNSNPGLVAVTFDADSALGLNVTPGMIGIAQIIILAFDASFVSSEDTFYVEVIDLGDMPVVANAIPDTTIDENSPTINAYRDLNDVFSDTEDGGALTFSVHDNSNQALVNVVINADSALDVSVTPSLTGDATIVIRATDSDGLRVDDTFVVTVQPVPTAIDDGMPTKTVLRQNYPNPFNPVTRISYDLAAPVQVVLKIYNSHGEEVRTLVDAHQPQGMWSVVWDGRNNAGRRVSSGVYFYKLSAGRFTAARKLVLLQ